MDDPRQDRATPGTDTSAWEPGRTLGSFRLAERIGRGGMGEVWLARDERLGRDVALKFVPEAYARDPARIERFEREARVLAKLDHPGIARIHGFHDVAGTRFFEMEYVPGEDLAARLARGPLDVDAALELAVAVCDALAAAHARGVVHRDLKPANIRLAPDGRVKVVDFGLARAIVEGESADPELSPTRTTPATAAGVLLGTAAYMSPEQARGRPVDARSDLWALGCVLYECLTGKRAFEGETVSDTLAAILRGEPDVEALPADLSPRVRRVLARCLAKDPDDRWRDAGDVALLLDDARRGTAVAGAGGARRPASRIARVAGAAVLLGGGVLLGVALQRSQQPEPRRSVVRATLEFPEDVYVSQVRISPDGRTVAAAAGHEDELQGIRLWLRDLSADEPREVEGALHHETVRFSPDSRFLVVAMRELPGSTGPVLARVPADGSAPPTSIAPWESSWADDAVWMRDGDLVLCDREAGTIVRVPTDGRPRPAPVPIRHELGDEREVLVHSEGPDGSVLGTVQAWDGGYHQDVVLLDPDTGTVKLLVDRGSEPTFVPPDRLVFSRSDRLLSIGFDPGAMAVFGSPTTVETGLRARVEVTYAGYGLSGRGDLVYLPGGVVGDRRRLTVGDESGGRELWPEAVGPFTESLDDSEDGRVIGVTRVGSTGLFESWACELLRAPFERVLAMPDMDCFGAIVSPRGRWLASFCMGRPERNGIWIGTFPPGGEPQRIYRAETTWGRLDMFGWVPDGSGLLVRPDRDPGSPILRIPFDENGPTGEDPVPVDGLGEGAESIAVSRDSRLVAVVARRGNRTELRIGRWNGGRAEGLRTVAEVTEGGLDWSGARDPRGRVLIFTGEGGVRRGIVDEDGRLIVSEPTPLGARPGWPLSMRNAFLPDGRVVRLEIDEDETTSRRVRVVLDWTAGLAEKVPGPP